MYRLTKTFEMNRVVVTGLGVVSPLGVGARKSWENLIEGNSGASRIEDPKFSSIPSKVACYVPETKDGFVVSEKFSKSEQERMSRSMLFGLVAAEEAFKDAKWSPKTESEKMITGVSVGMGMVDLEYIGGCHLELEAGKGRRISPYFVPRILPNLSAGHISIAHGLMGPNLSCSTACATGSHAIADAFRMIERGDCSVMLAGGVDACINPLAYMGFSRARALSTKYNDEPQTASRPFDKGRDGFVMGEGAGVMVLESLQHARERNASIYCELLGYGMSGDADHITAAREDGRGAYLAMKSALKCLPSDCLDHIWQINAHATSTPRGDMAELGAINSLLSGSRSNPLITANKSCMGHLLGAAGGVESCFAALSIQENVVPPSINITELDTDITKGLNIVVERRFSPAEAEVPDHLPNRMVLKNSFGFGGTNVSLLFAQYEP